MKNSKTMKSCKTKKTLFLGMTTLLSSLILFGCNSGSSAQNGVVINHAKNGNDTRAGEPIRAFTSDGRYMFVVSQDLNNQSHINLFKVAHSRAVTSPSQSSVIGSHTKIVAITLVQDKYLFAISSDGYIYEYKLSGTSSNSPTFTENPGIDNSAYTPSPSAMTSSADGGSLFIIDFTNKYVQMGSVDANGVLTLNHKPDKMGTTSLGPNSIAVSKDGKYAYVTNSQDNSISEFSIDKANLQLSALPQQFATCPGGGVCGGSNPSNIELSPNGQYAYVADYGGNYINIYNINSSNGYLSYQGYIGAGNNPSSIHIDQNGFYAYVYNSDGYNGFTNPSISQYAISNSGSTLTPIGTPIILSSLPADNKPNMITTDNKGHIYAYNNVGQYLELFSATQNGSTPDKGDDCDYKTFSYVTQGPTNLTVPTCASYMTQIAVGGGGGVGGHDGGGGGNGGIGFARDIPVTGSDMQLSGFVGGGGGGGGYDGPGKFSAGGAPGGFSSYGGPSYRGVNGTNCAGGGGGGGGSYFTISTSSSVPVYAGGGGGGGGYGGGGGGAGAGNDYGGVGAFNDTGNPGGNGTSSIFTPNSIFFPSNIYNGAGQGLVMVMFTTKPIGDENYWVPGGSWSKTCVPGPRFYTPQNNNDYTGTQGAIDYVCSAGQNGDTIMWNQGTLQMSDTSNNPFYNNKFGTVVPN